MYTITKSGVEIAVTERPTYIRLQSNGAFGLCTREQAQGVAWEGVPYHVEGMPAIDREGIETVTLTEIDGGKRITQNEQQAASSRKIAEVAFITMAEADTIPQTVAAQYPEAFPAWQAGVAYKLNQYRTETVDGETKLYRCVQAHTSQAGWEPHSAASLWTLAADPGEAWPAWIYPTGAHNAYALGAQVTHNGKRWRSTVANNVWEPGAYGWEEVTTDE